MRRLKKGSRKTIHAISAVKTPSNVSTGMRWSRRCAQAPHQQAGPSAPPKTTVASNHGKSACLSLVPCCRPRAIMRANPRPSPNRSLAREADRRCRRWPSRPASTGRRERQRQWLKCLRAEYSRGRRCEPWRPVRSASGPLDSRQEIVDPAVERRAGVGVIVHDRRQAGPVLGRCSVESGGSLSKMIPCRRRRGQPGRACAAAALRGRCDRAATGS